MTMPIDLVLVRHGQSEQNVANHAAKNGDSSLFTDAFRARHVSRHRLSGRGQEQAKTTGAWLRDNDLGKFDRRYVSTYVRAIETAGLLDINGPEWMLDAHLREREWGDFDGLTWEERAELSAQSVALHGTDSLYWIPPSGESIVQLALRLRAGVLRTLHDECSRMRVIIVCHGEVMWAFRFLLERMTVARWTELESSKDPGAKIYNGQVLHYSRRNPSTGELSKRLDWFRSVCPPDPSNNGPGWEPIIRPTFSNEQLLAIATDTPHLFPDQAGY